MYDITCNLKKHLKVMYCVDLTLSACALQANSRLDLFDDFEFAVPVFHAYGHESACQVG